MTKAKKEGLMRRRIMRKGIMSGAVFFIMISIFFIAYIFLVNSIRLRAIASEDLLADRIFYIFYSIERSVISIIEEQLGNVSAQPFMEVAVNEGPNFNYVKFSERLPQDVSSFKSQLTRFEDFAEAHLNETNIIIDTTVEDIGDSMAIGLSPYKITYNHSQPWGDNIKREFNVTPADDAYGAGSLNGYEIIVNLTGGWNVTPATAQWPFLVAGNLKFNITILSGGGGLDYSTTQYLSKDQKSQFRIDTNTTQGGYQEGWIEAVVSEGGSAKLFFHMSNSEALVETKLNLTEIGGKTDINLIEGKINVVETTYNIEKNDTVKIR